MKDNLNEIMKQLTFVPLRGEINSQPSALAIEIRPTLLGSNNSSLAYSISTLNWGCVVASHDKRNEAAEASTT